ncbi:hypothetical protein FHG87_021811 [Trinorchestia longiramus]|nr:hypothetical protein FHG87_021811 [Trinorchestia longiramus]
MTRSQAAHASKSHILQSQLLQSRYNLYSTSRSPKQWSLSAERFQSQHLHQELSLPEKLHSQPTAERRKKKPAILSADRMRANNLRTTKNSTRSNSVPFGARPARYQPASTRHQDVDTDFEHPCLKTLWTFPNWCCCCFQQPQPLLCTTPSSGIGSCSTPTPHTKWTLFARAGRCVTCSPRATQLRTFSLDLYKYQSGRHKYQSGQHKYQSGQHKYQSVETTNMFLTEAETNNGSLKNQRELCAAETGALVQFIGTNAEHNEAKKLIAGLVLNRAKELWLWCRSEIRGCGCGAGVK